MTDLYEDLLKDVSCDILYFLCCQKKKKKIKEMLFYLYPYSSLFFLVFLFRHI